MNTPALVLVAHGTRSTKGVQMIASLAEAVARELGAPPETGAGAVFGAAPAPLTETTAAAARSTHPARVTAPGVGTVQRGVAVPGGSVVRGASAHDPDTCGRAAFGAVVGDPVVGDSVIGGAAVGDGADGDRTGYLDFDRVGHGVGPVAAMAHDSTVPDVVRGAAPTGASAASRAGGAPSCGCGARSAAPVRFGVEAPRVRTAFVDVLGPSPAEVLRDLDSVPAVVVPAFLASGYHVYQDVPREVAASAHDAVAVTHAMGPDPALAAIMRMRLRAAGWRPGDAVVFAAAGSSDARARQDVRRAAGLLAEQIGSPVRTAYIATGAPRVPEVVAQVRESGARRVFIASYLLAHGLFHQRLHECGADGVADPIGVHPAVVRLIADRYRAAARTLTAARVA
ncbi:sirohydrochlorin cobaltochelatase [Nocardia otitidiscaviarum]|uniref:Sirohydrochlorin cobaltochelatase n=2 Tax=Nocardia otitidiscaviarum TaxID=1823 RepID=A0A378Y8Q6_9NOCA|nr:sirohydrochlorin cobaltochelatase [Nocardia otitidiscaviarum]